MENNNVKILIEGVDPKTGETHKMNFEGDAVCAITIKDADGGVSAEECLMGSVNLDRALALVKGLASACRHLLDHLNPAMASIIMGEMLHEIMGKVEDDEQADLKAYDERRFS